MFAVLRWLPPSLRWLVPGLVGYFVGAGVVRTGNVLTGLAAPLAVAAALYLMNQKG